MKLKEREVVVVAWAERVWGPGWSNTPIWYIIKDGNGKLREDCLQPNEQTAHMSVLFETNAVSTAAMTSLVQRALEGKGK